MYSLLLVGLGVFCFLPSKVEAFEVDTHTAIKYPLHLSQITEHQPTVRIENVAAQDTVDVIIDNNKVAAVVPDHTSFVYTLDTPLVSGIHYLNIRRGDLLSRTILFEVLPYPSVPVVTSPMDGETVATSQPVIEGSAERDSTVEIIIDSKTQHTIIPEQQTPLDADESLFATQSAPLPNGKHSVSARIVDQYGTVSAPSGKVYFTVASAFPAPTLFTPIVNLKSSYSRPWIVGNVHNGLTVSLYIDGVLDGDTTPQNHPSGVTSFAYRPVQKLSPGDHVISATAQDNWAVSPPSYALEYRVALPSPQPIVLGEATFIDTSAKGSTTGEESERIASTTGLLTEKDGTKSAAKTAWSFNKRLIGAGFIVVILLYFWWLWQKEDDNSGLGTAKPPANSHQKSFWS